MRHTIVGSIVLVLTAWLTLLLCTAVIGQDVPSSTRALLTEAGKNVARIDPGQARALFDAGVVFVDVRDAHAFKSGHVPGALSIPRGNLEFRCHHVLPQRTVSVVVYSEQGRRSLLAAQTLLDLGYANVKDFAGGWVAWSTLGNPVELGE